MVRRFGHFDQAEDAVQEALLAAARSWPTGTIPNDPRAWLITVASRRLTDLLRSDQARRRREATVAQWTVRDQWLAPAADATPTDGDDTLILLFMCCHPSLPVASQISLTLRAVGGLTTAEVARAFLVSEATMTRRISRAKQGIKDSHLPFRMPTADQQAERLDAVLHALYLIFNEGYASTSGPQLIRADLAAEGIRLARIVHRLLPRDPEVRSLLALLLLTDARRPARTGPTGELIPMAEQDRTLWIEDLIAEGLALIEPVPIQGAGPYQLQALIAAAHDRARRSQDTDWSTITAAYEALLRLSDNPMVALNHAVAVSMSSGAPAGLQLLVSLEHDQRLRDDHRLHAVRAHLLERVGDLPGAQRAFTAAAERAASLPQKRYLLAQAARLSV